MKDINNSIVEHYRNQNFRANKLYKDYIKNRQNSNKILNLYPKICSLKVCKIYLAWQIFWLNIIFFPREYLYSLKEFLWIKIFRINWHLRALGIIYIFWDTVKHLYLILMLNFFIYLTGSLRQIKINRYGGHTNYYSIC